MADVLRPPKRRSSAVLTAGSYALERRPVWLRPPAPAPVLPAYVEPEPDPAVRAAEEAAAAELAALEATGAELAVPAGPSVEELARQEAAGIVEAARAEAEELRRIGREQGYTEGLKEGVEAGRAQGREEGQRELAETLDRWRTMGDVLVEAWKSRFAGVEEEIKDVAIAAAERLVQQHLAVAPGAVVDVVRDALRHAAEADAVTVLICPKDAGLVRAAKEELAASFKGTGRFEILEDPNVEPGACVVETRTQVIDATQKTRLDLLREAMRKEQA